MEQFYSFYFYYTNIHHRFIKIYQSMQSTSQSKHKSTASLPHIIDNKYIRQEVQRRIKNKIQPLSYKYFLLKSGRCLTNKSNIQYTLRDKISEHKHTIANRQSQHKQKIKQKVSSLNLAKFENKRRRKALVQNNLMQLQAKVQQHIMLKRMNIMENQFQYAEECGKTQKQKMCKKLRRSPIQKYVIIFEKSQQPTQKKPLIKQSSCQQMLKQIKTAKNIKEIQCVQQNMRNMFNSQTTQVQIKINKENNIKNKHININDKQNHEKRINYSKRQEKKLRQQIMKDIKKQYQMQGSSKIRININHKKMIQL